MGTEIDTTAIDALGCLLADKEHRAIAAGASEAEALDAVRGLWLEAILPGAKLQADLCEAGYDALWARGKGGGQWVQGYGYLSHLDAIRLLEGRMDTKDGTRMVSCQHGDGSCPHRFFYVKARVFPFLCLDHSDQEMLNTDHHPHRVALVWG